MGNPTKDPHGDPIPDAKGKIISVEKILLSDLQVNENCICVGVKDTSSEFLKYLDRQKISLGAKMEIIAKETFDMSIKIKLEDKELVISNKIASNIFVKIT